MRDLPFTVIMNIAGLVITLAGGTPGSADGHGTAAQLWGPTGVAVDASGNVFVTESPNIYSHSLVRKIDTSGLNLECMQFLACNLSCSRVCAYRVRDHAGRKWPAGIFRWPRHSRQIQQSDRSCSGFYGKCVRD